MRIREARSEDADGIARVRVDTWRTQYSGIVPERSLTKLSYTDSAARWRAALTEIARRVSREECVYVAENEAGEVIGFAMGGPNRTKARDTDYAGELYAIYILDGYQGQGIGRELMRCVAAALAKRGMTTLLVWVLSANPSRRFYEALGGQYVRDDTFEIDGVTIPEVSYGWKDTRPLYE